MLSISIFYAVSLWIEVAHGEGKLDRNPYVNDAIEYKLTISPVVVDAERFTRSLFPPFKSRLSGNAVTDYWHAVRIAPDSKDKIIVEQSHRWSEWQSSLPSEILPEAIDRDIGLWRDSISLLRRGALCESCDWNDRRPVTASSEIYSSRDQQFRSVLNWSVIDHKRQLQKHQFDLSTIQSIFQTAKRIGERPSMIQLLSGTAMASLGARCITDWMSVPDSPTLYFALATRPRPFFDQRVTWEGEEEYRDNVLFQEMKLSCHRVLSSQEIVQNSAKSNGLFHWRNTLQLNLRTHSTSDSWGAIIFGENFWNQLTTLYVCFGHSKQYLLDRKYDPKLVCRMHPLQVIAVAHYLYDEDIFQKSRAVALMAFPIAITEVHKLDQQINNSKNMGSRFPFQPMPRFSPRKFASNANSISCRLWRRFACISGRRENGPMLSARFLVSPFPLIRPPENHFISNGSANILN